MKNKVTKIQTTYVDKQLSHSQCVQVPRCTLDPNNCNFEANQKGSRRLVILLPGAFK